MKNLKNLKNDSNKLNRFETIIQKREKKHNLPKNSRAPNLKLSSNPYLKLFMQQNDTHTDNEKAHSLSKNIGGVYSVILISFQ